MSLGHRIRYYREKRKWTLDDLATRCGPEVNVGTLSALENRDSQRSKFAPLIAKAFGLTIEQLLDEQRDWLHPDGTPIAQRPGHRAEAPAAHYSNTRWLFSDDLFAALQHKKRAELDHLEELVRLHLRLPALSTLAGKRRVA